VPPEGFRGKPHFDPEVCVGCTGCQEVCPAIAISFIDDLDATPPKRTIQVHYDKCIFCGQCALNCTTDGGITLTTEYDLATLDRSECVEQIEHELVLCEMCGEIIGTRRHLQWVADRLDAKVYANPTLLAATADGLNGDGHIGARMHEPAIARNDMMRMTCPACRRTLVVRELWGE
jgi:formate hydrogenlyase subunit 6/NADH:ubiquinone oxidoreductase subunit I